MVLFKSEPQVNALVELSLNRDTKYLALVQVFPVGIKTVDPEKSMGVLLYDRIPSLEELREKVYEIGNKSVERATTLMESNLQYILDILRDVERLFNASVKYEVVREYSNGVLSEITVNLQSIKGDSTRIRVGKDYVVINNNIYFTITLDVIDNIRNDIFSLFGIENCRSRVRL